MNIKVFKMWFMTFLLMYCLTFVYLQPLIGRADMLYKYSEKCDTGNNDSWNFTVKTKKLSRKSTSITFWIDSKTVIDEKIGIQVDVAQMGNGGWKNVYNMFIKDGCGVISTKKAIFNKILKDSNITSTSKCPLPKVPIYFDNYVLNVDDLAISNILPYSSIRLDTLVKRNKKGIVCLRNYIDIVPAKN